MSESAVIALLAIIFEILMLSFGFLWAEARTEVHKLQKEKKEQEEHGTTT